MKTFTSSDYDANSISSLSVFTLVLWTGCALVSWFGFVLPYAHPLASPPPPPPVRVEMLEVKLADDPQPKTEQSRNSSVTDPLAQPQIPQPIAVAQPSPAIAFALPVKGPVQIVAARYPAHTQTPPAPSPAPAPQNLTFGEGEGKQPAPEYPGRARREGEEGAVTVRFTVAEDGHVAVVEPIAPCRWPLLNDSVLRVVRERWRFSSGPLRVYDVQIRFVLTQ